jgi:8-oxo-dGTP pyrophosphatase MutT (NUDIX family)
MDPPPRRVFTGRVVALELAEVRLPNGQVAELEVVRHPGGAAIVAINAAGEVCLLHQYRHVAGGWLWEIPAGKLDGRPPDEVARSELREEAGRTASSWESLGRVLSSPGVFTEVVHLYLARDLTVVPSEPERDEVFEASWVPLAVAAGRALRGEIEDGKSVIALLRAAARLGVAPEAT